MSAAPDYREWIGRTERREDVIGPWQVNALAATLDCEQAFAPGDALPPGWHWIFFLEARRASGLGPDGHPKRGGFLPPVELPRRMWAGGRIDFERPLRVGDAVSRVSTIKNVEEKAGASGKLVFVTLSHEIRAGEAVAIVEEQDLVYREAAKPGEVPQGKPAPSDPAWSRRLRADPVLLFRYSALTFNGHRIHYDREYATREEHYPGLVVHGPLQSTLLLEMCRAQVSRPVARLEYRALHPVFEHESFSVCGNPAPDSAKAELWTANSAGCYGMRATAYF